MGLMRQKKILMKMFRPNTEKAIKDQKKLHNDVLHRSNYFISIVILWSESHNKRDRSTDLSIKKVHFHLCVIN
jgi:hypothetical protein